MPSSSSPSSSPLLLAASLAGIAAAVGLWRQRQNASCCSKSRKRKSSSGDDLSSDTTVSVEGSVMVTLPTWAIASTPEYSSRHYTTDIEMMSLAIHLSDRNITEGTGGPFGAAIFERHPPTAAQLAVNPNDKGYCTLVSIGMNRVVPLGNSTLHGEMVAIQLAQRKVGSFTLMIDSDENDTDQHSGLFYEEDGKEESDNHENGKDSTAAASGDTTNKGKKRQFELFTSCEPCAMCLGGTLWSGVSRIVCGARKEDAQAIGFDEGPVFEQSYEHLEKCGVEVTRGVLVEEAASVLRRYGREGLIYNR